MSYKQIIIKYLESRNNWVSSYDLEKVNTPFGWIGTSGSRRCKELAEKGLIEVKHEHPYVYYRAKASKLAQDAWNKQAMCNLPAQQAML